MKFEPGQVWMYRTRKCEEASRITVIEADDSAVHIYLDNLKLKSPAGRNIEDVFMPIELSALEKSVKALELEMAPDFTILRDKWSKSHDTRGQGWFTMEIDSFLSMLEHANSA